jgi:hypothetical protein
MNEKPICVLQRYASGDQGTGKCVAESVGLHVSPGVIPASAKQGATNRLPQFP